MKIGYARVSTKQQDTELQLKALQDAGCEKIFTEQESGGRWDRPELQTMMTFIRKGDVVVVWKIDRLSRSLKDLLILIEKIDKLGCGFQSLTESIDTTSVAGRMMMQIIGAFAEFERAVLRERTMRGLEHAREEGRVGGRPRSLNEHQKKEIVNLITGGHKTAADTARLFRVHPSTISRLLQQSKNTDSLSSPKKSTSRKGGSTH